jgi:hypothetical protein
MGKQSGLGDNCYVGGYDLSGDIGSLRTIGAPMSPLEVTGISKSAPERLGGVRNGQFEFSSFWNTAALQEHAALSTLLTTDRLITYCRGTSLGDPAACMLGKQINYDPARTADGGMMASVQAQSNGYGLEWGVQLTAGVRTDSSATSPGTGVDTLASASFGIQAYLQVFSFAGTSVTITVQDSADNASFANISGLSAFTVVSSAPTTERIFSTNTTTVRRYLRVITAGTFSNAAFSVVVVKNELAGQVF